MPTYAHIETRERRQFEPAPPANKAHLWLLVVEGERPAPAAGQYVSESVAAVGNELRISYALHSREAADLAAMIKTEAQRRIIAAMGAQSFEACVVKQLNALKRAAALTKQLASGQAWTEAEATEAAALEALSAHVDAIRARSNELEADPPIDIDNDAHWPE